MGFDSINDIWETVCDELRTKITDVGFKLWIAELKPVEIKDNKFILSINNKHKKEIVEMHYTETIQNACFDSLGLNLKVEIIVDEPKIEEVIEKPKISSSTDNYTFENFIVGQSNEFAHAVAVAIAERPGDIYNPLYIHGNSGVGKTHLILAIKNRILEKYPEKKVIYMRGEEFTNKFLTALRDQTTAEFHEEFRSVDVLIVDDVHFFANKDSTQEEFFNTFNSIYQENKQIIITADRPPKEIKTLPERITSRFEGGMVVDMSPPDFETRVGILDSKAKQLGLTIEKELLYKIAEQIKTNTRQLEGIIKKIYAYTIIHHENVNVSIIQAFIRDIIQEVEEKITPEKVVEEVARTYGIDSRDIFSTRKSAEIAYARQVSMYIIKETTMMKYIDIAKKFGKHHSTILYDIEKVRKTMDVNEKEKEIINSIIKNLEQTL